MQQQSFNLFMVVFVKNRRKTWPLSVCVRRRREQGGHVWQMCLPRTNFCCCCHDVVNGEPAWLRPARGARIRSKNCALLLRKY